MVTSGTPQVEKIKKQSTVFNLDVKGRYTVKIKTMCDKSEKNSKDICPMCGSKHKKFLLKREHRTAKYITEWEFECPTCRTPLYIINDENAICYY